MSQRGYRIGLAAMMLLALFGLGYYWIQATRQVNGFGFPLDDSWIHLQIARNLASGHGWSFNPGEPTGAATSPLWVLIITPLFYLGGDVTVWVKALGVLLYLANVLLVANVAMLTVGDRRVGVGAGMLAAMQPALIWAALSGMETALYLLLFLLSLRSLFLSEQRGRPAAYASTVWLSLAGWARPEMWALLPLLWGYLLWRRREAAYRPLVGTCRARLAGHRRVCPVQHGTVGSSNPDNIGSQAGHFGRIRPRNGGCCAVSLGRLRF